MTPVKLIGKVFMKPNNTKPGIGKYTSLRERYKREAQEKPKQQPRYSKPTFPYTYNKNARVSFLDQVHTLQYKEIEPPTPREIPIPYSLLTEIQLLRLLSGVR
jgi:hypothetical protein